MDECMEGCRIVRIADDLAQTITLEVWADDCNSDMTALLGISCNPYKSHHIAW